MRDNETQLLMSVFTEKMFLYHLARVEHKTSSIRMCRLFTIIIVCKKKISIVYDLFVADLLQNSSRFINCWFTKCLGFMKMHRSNEHVSRQHIIKNTLSR